MSKKNQDKNSVTSEIQNASSQSKVLNVLKNLVERPLEEVKQENVGQVVCDASLDSPLSSTESVEVELSEVPTVDLVGLGVQEDPIGFAPAIKETPAVASSISQKVSAMSPKIVPAPKADNRVEELLSLSMSYNLEMDRAINPEKALQHKSVGSGDLISEDAKAALYDSLNDDLDFVLEAQLNSADMQHIPASWKIEGDMTVDRGLLLDGTVKGRVHAPSHVVVVGEGGVAQGGVVCHLLVCCGRVEGEVFADEIIVGETGNLDANNIHVTRGKLSISQGASFTGKMHNI